MHLIKMYMLKICLSLFKLLLCLTRKFYIGKNEEVLFEEKAVIGDKEYFVGYTKEYVKVAKETAENLENQIVSGRISGMLTDEILLFE